MSFFLVFTTICFYCLYQNVLCSPILVAVYFWGFCIFEYCVRRKIKFDLQTSFTPEILIQFPFHCFWIWWEIFQNSSPFFLQPSSYRSLPAGQPWASALSCLVCWRFRPPAWFGAASTGCWCRSLLQVSSPGSASHWLGRTDYYCRSTARFWYKERGNWFLVPLGKKQRTKNVTIWQAVNYNTVSVSCRSVCREMVQESEGSGVKTPACRPN